VGPVYIDTQGPCPVKPGPNSSSSLPPSASLAAAAMSITGETARGDDGAWPVSVGLHDSFMPWRAVQWAGTADTVRGKTRRSMRRTRREVQARTKVTFRYFFGSPGRGHEQNARGGAQLATRYQIRGGARKPPPGREPGGLLMARGQVAFGQSPLDVQARTPAGGPTLRRRASGLAERGDLS